MAEAQTVYADTLAAGFAGMVANGETSNRITRTCEDAAGIGFGVPVYEGTAPHTCTRTATAGKLLGITIADQHLGLVSGQDADEYAQYENVAIMTQGVIFVTAGEAVTARAPAYDTGTAIVDTATDNDAMTGWEFDEAAANGALVKLAKR